MDGCGRKEREREGDTRILIASEARRIRRSRADTAKQGEGGVDLAMC